MLIIGFNGRKGSGKDTAGAYLIENYGFEKISYAALLKESAAALFDVAVDAWEDWKNDPDVKVEIKVEGIIIVSLTAREFLQRYGTEAHRDVFGDSFWREAMWAALPEEIRSKRYVITDARFEDELKDIARKDGFVARIERAGLDTLDAHASEAEPDAALIDFWIRNDGTIEDLHEELETLMRAMGIEAVVQA